MNEKKFFIAAAVGMIAAYALIQFTLIITDKISTTLGIIQLLIGSFTWILMFFCDLSSSKEIRVNWKKFANKIN